MPLRSRTALTGQSRRFVGASNSYPVASSAPHMIEDEDSQLESQAVLQNVFGRCVHRPQADFAVLCCTISCVATSQRPLSPAEIKAACILFLRLRNDKDATAGQEEHIEQSASQWRDIAGCLLKDGEDDSVEFAVPGIKHFLRTHRIKGVDLSHFTLAKLCQARTSVEDQAESKQELSFGISALLTASSDFSKYAHEYLQTHTRHAEQQCLNVGLTSTEIIQQ